MLGFAGSSYALFAVAWAAMCLLAAALVTDAMLRDASEAAAVDAEPRRDATATEA